MENQNQPVLVNPDRFAQLMQFSEARERERYQRKRRRERGLRVMCDYCREGIHHFCKATACSCIHHTFLD